MSGRTVVVTGAARGLGAAFATGLAEAGADLVLVDRTEPAETAAAVISLGRRCRSYVADLAETPELAPLVDTIRREAGPIHVLVNNAGVARLEQFNEITPAGWREVMAVNAEAPFFLAQRVAEHMIADGIEGRIVNISSKNGLVAEAGLAHYNASKAALELITKSLAAELGPHGITCNAVAPGMIETPIADDFDVDLAGLFEAWRARIPLRGGFGRPEDCVGAVVYLASDAGRYVTGTTLLVDGGALADQLPRLRFLPPYRSSL
nr:SDR family oxidoreductase [Kribbella shirazensis]